jgi:membrane associated rhomboid family serine protease
VDFGFPGFLVPLLTIGLALGCAAQYFMTRDAPAMIRRAFATAALFLSFAFEMDIDKALGGFVTSVLAMVVVFRFVYPVIMPRKRGRWSGTSGRNRQLKTR